MIWRKFKTLSFEKQVTIILTAIGMTIGAGWKGYTYFSKKPTPSHSKMPIVSIEGSTSLGSGIIHVISTGSGAITINTKSSQDADIIEELLSNQVEKNQKISALTQQAIELEKTIKTLRTRKDQPESQVALAFLAKGDTSKAEQFFNKILVLKKKEGRKALKEAAATARNIGSLAYLHDTQKAIQAYIDATILDPDNPSGWNQLGLLLDLTGDLYGAEKCFNIVLTIGEKTNSPAWMAIAYGNQGNVYRIRGNLEKSIEMHNKSLKLDQALGNKQGMSANYINLGIIYQMRGNLDQAVELFNKALEIDLDLGGKEGIATDYSNLGIAYRMHGNLENAVKMFNKSLVINQALGRKRRIANQYVNLGIVYGTREDLDKAIEALNKALKIYNTLENKYGMAVVYVNLGHVYEIRGDLIKTTDLYNKSIALFQEIGAKSMVIKVQEGQSGTDHDKKKRQKDAEQTHTL